MRIQLHFEINEEDGRLWYKRYFVNDFPCLPQLYDYIEGASILQGLEQDEDILSTINLKVYYVSQTVWLRDEQGVYPLIVCSERDMEDIPK